MRPEVFPLVYNLLAARRVVWSFANWSDILWATPLPPLPGAAAAPWRIGRNLYLKGESKDQVFYTMVYNTEGISEL